MLSVEIFGFCGKANLLSVDSVYEGNLRACLQKLGLSYKNEDPACTSGVLILEFSESESGEAPDVEQRCSPP